MPFADNGGRTSGSSRVSNFLTSATTSGIPWQTAQIAARCRSQSCVWPAMGATRSPGFGPRAERGTVERTFRIADGDFAHLGGHGMLHRRQSQHGMANDVADGLRHGIVHRPDPGQSSGGLKDFIPHATALGAVTVEQVFAADAANHQCELPREVEGVRGKRSVRRARFQHK